MTYKNLDTAVAFKSLQALATPSLATLLSAERITEAVADAGGGLSYRWAAMPVAEEHLATFQALSEEMQLIQKYRSLLGGEVMNTGEGRAVLHHLARGELAGEVIVDGENKGAFYQKELKKIRAFSEAVRSGEITSSTGESFTSVVQIGIGGSDLGPRALYLALEGWAAEAKIKRVDGHFISNVDPDDAAAILADLDLSRSLFIVVSKSGTTLETLTNLELVIEAMQAQGLDPAKQIVAVTSKSSPMAQGDQFLEAFFIDDYIGGRYSATSAVGGVILSVAYGYESFAALLAGAHAADRQALEPSVEKNAALLDALIGLYLRNVLSMPTTAILPYSQALSRFAAHLQQLDMESNGKSVNREGAPLGYVTGPIIFGEPGTNGQHSFYQLLHQGTDIVPLQFIGFQSSQYQRDVIVEDSSSQEKLNANLAAQIVAFARGKEDENANKRFTGERPSSLLIAERLTPEVLGALLAHYENKVMFQGFLWNINSFDQEGVQLGKVLATSVLEGSKDDPVLKAWASLFGL